MFNSIKLHVGKISRSEEFHFGGSFGYFCTLID